jgi:ketosteroid isomerase-like protein
VNIDTWVERYGRAWREKDDEAVADLFTEGATYASHPLQPPHRGRDGIRAYWRRATADQEELDLRFGEPVVSADGKRAAVEWWAQMRDEGWAAGEGAEDDRLTLPGCLMLRFAESGLCKELREYWNVGFGPPVRPPEGWGG